MALDIANPSDEMQLSRQEARDLLRYLLSNGYISYEFHKEIHDLEKRLTEFCGHEFVISVVQDQARDYRSRVCPQDLARERG